MRRIQIRWQRFSISLSGGRAAIILAAGAILAAVLPGCSGAPAGLTAGSPESAPTSTALASASDAGRALIALSSRPFPLAVGHGDLLIALHDAAGAPINDADRVEVVGEMIHEGMLPMRGATRGPGADGVYRVPIVWSMSGPHIVTVAASSRGGDEIASEQFEVFVYAVPPQADHIARATFKTLDERASERASTETEYRIVIPQGAFAQVTAGQGDEFIPDEIRLSVTGQHTLVIQNDDVVDHTIGPFFVRAGETLRQTFKRPDIYQGSCSIRHDATLSIIVEE